MQGPSKNRLCPGETVFWRDSSRPPLGVRQGSPVGLPKGFPGSVKVCFEHSFEPYIKMIWGEAAFGRSA
jgi:hypothetical protein